MAQPCMRRRVRAWAPAARAGPRGTGCHGRACAQPAARAVCGPDVGVHAGEPRACRPRWCTCITRACWKGSTTIAPRGTYSTDARPAAGRGHAAPGDRWRDGALAHTQAHLPRHLAGRALPQRAVADRAEGRRRCTTLGSRRRRRCSRQQHACQGAHQLGCRAVLWPAGGAGPSAATKQRPPPATHTAGHCGRFQRRAWRGDAGDSSSGAGRAAAVSKAGCGPTAGRSACGCPLTVAATTSASASAACCAEQQR